MGNEQLKGHLDMLLLQVIAGCPSHGYQLVCALRERSNGAFDVPEGTLYPALHRLEAKGLITSEWERGATRRRRIYRLTARGRRALQKQRDEWFRFAKGVGDVIGVTA
jgi:transcriptional regulator